MGLPGRVSDWVSAPGMGAGPVPAWIAWENNVVVTEPGEKCGPRENCKEALGFKAV